MYSIDIGKLVWIGVMIVMFDHELGVIGLAGWFTPAHLL